MTTRQNPLRLNVGFLLQQPVGTSRDFLFDYPGLRLSSDLELDTFTGKARISRTPQGLLLQANLQASLSMECVRCLTAFPQTLHSNFTELYAFSQRSVSESELLLPESGIIDLAPIVREYLILEFPISPLCQPDCKGLCPICGENRNETTCDHGGQEIDPRMAALQALLKE